MYSALRVLKCLRIEYLRESVHRALNFAFSNAESAFLSPSFDFDFALQVFLCLQPINTLRAWVINLILYILYIYIISVLLIT